MVVTRADRHGKRKAVQPGNREWSTAVCSINSRDRCIPPFIVLQVVYHLEHWYQNTNLPTDWVLNTSPNGWTNNDIGLEWVKHFEKHTRLPSHSSRLTQPLDVGLYSVLKRTYGH